MSKMLRALRVALNLRMTACDYHWAHYAEL
jgi:hypothetical protein